MVRLSRSLMCPGILTPLSQTRPYVHEANKLGPTYARIYKEMILIADPNKPLTRSGKGTVQRKAALIAYADDISRL